MKKLLVAALAAAGAALADNLGVLTADTDRGYREVTHAFRHMKGAPPAVAVERRRFEPTSASLLRGQHGCPWGSRLEDISPGRGIGKLWVHSTQHSWNVSVLTHA